MSRYFHGGPNGLDVEAHVKAHGVDEKDRERLRKELTDHHPLSQPARNALVVRDGKTMMKKPGLYCQLDPFSGNPIPEYVAWEPGSLTFGVPGYQFFVVPPGSYIDIDHTVPEDLVKSLAPQLLTEAEAVARGVIKPVAEPVMLNQKQKHV